MTDQVAVTYVIGTLRVGGAERQLMYLIEGLDSRHFRPSVIAFEGGAWERRLDALGISFDLVDLSRGKVRGVFAVRRRLRRRRSRIVQTFGDVADYIGRAGALLARTPIIIGSDRGSPLRKTRALLWADAILGRLSDRVVCNSEHARRFYRDHGLIPAERLETIYNAIDLDRFRPRHGRGATFEIGYLANLRPEKNHLTLLLAVAEVCAARPDARFHLAGDGPMYGQIADRCRELGLEGRVVVHGEVEDVPGFLRSLDIYVHASDQEGMSNAIMEAMATGLPVIAADVGGNRELIEPGRNGLLVNGSDAAGIARAIRRLADDPLEAQQMGAYGRERIERKFTVGRMAGEMTRLYEDLLARDAGRHTGGVRRV